METMFRPIPLDTLHWTGGRCRRAATLAIAPEVLQDWRGVQFERGRDEQDEFRAAGLELPSGRRVLLWWYERAPEPRGLDIRIDDVDDPRDAREETLSSLDISEHEVMWRAVSGD